MFWHCSQALGFPQADDLMLLGVYKRLIIVVGSHYLFYGPVSHGSEPHVQLKRFMDNCLSYSCLVVFDPPFLDDQHTHLLTLTSTLSGILPNQPTYDWRNDCIPCGDGVWHTCCRLWHAWDWYPRAKGVLGSGKLPGMFTLPFLSCVLFLRTCYWIYRAGEASTAVAGIAHSLRRQRETCGLSGSTDFVQRHDVVQPSVIPIAIATSPLQHNGAVLVVAIFAGKGQHCIDVA